MRRIAWLNRDLSWLLAGRIIRSLTQAYLVIIVPLYLEKIGFGPARVGEFLGVVTIGGTVVGLFSGLVADRYGRRTVLGALAFATAVGAAVFGLTRNFALLALAAALGTIGRGGGVGSGGAMGPFFGAEQALVSEHVTHADRNRVFSALSFVGTLAGAAGSLLATWAEVRHFGPGGQLQGYLWLFWLTAFLGLVLVALVLPVTERPDRLKPTVRSLSWHLVGRLSLTNAVNGLGVGFLGPFLGYWFHRRYGVGPASLGELYTLINLLSAVPYLGAARLSRRFGSVRTVVGARLGSAALLALLPIAPDFALAGVVLAGRTLFNTVSLPLRQSYAMGVAKEEERSTVAALSSLPAQVTAAIGPPVGGHLLAAGILEVPMWLAGFFQLGNALLYWRLFGGVRPPEERGEEGLAPESGDGGDD